MLDAETLEMLINLFEREAFVLTPQVNCSDEVPLSAAIAIASSRGIKSGRHVEGVYRYWIEKRKRIGKALMRQFQQPPPVEDPSPFIAFRPRQPQRRISHRNPRKNDAMAFDKIRFIQRDFKRLLDVLDVMLQRETMKRDSVSLMVEVSALAAPHAGIRHLC